MQSVKFFKNKNAITINKKKKTTAILYSVYMLGNVSFLGSVQAKQQVNCCLFCEWLRKEWQTEITIVSDCD